MMVMMSVRFLLRRETSDTINVSPFFILEISRPSLRPLYTFLPLTISVTHRSTTIPFSFAYLVISSCWFSGCCFPVLTLMYPVIMILDDRISAMSRPMAKFAFVTNDLQDFIVRAMDSGSGYSFTSKITLISKTEAELGFYDGEHNIII